MEQLDCVCDATLPSWETHGNLMVGSICTVICFCMGPANELAEVYCFFLLVRPPVCLSVRPLLWSL